MKRITAIVLILLYSLTSLALGIKMHYCAGEYVGITLAIFGGTKNCGCNHNMESHNRCCDDTIVKIDIDSHSIVQLYPGTNPLAETFIFPIYSTSQIELNVADDFVNAYPLEEAFRSKSPSINILFCIFRI